MTTSPAPDATESRRIPRYVSALMAALRLHQADSLPLRSLSDAEWHELLSFCELAGLTLALTQLPADNFPGWVVERLTQNAIDNAARFERIKATYREIAQAFEEAHVECVVLKGFAQYPGYVKRPELRVQSDLDLYCPPDQIDRAKDALQSLGYHADTRYFHNRADHLPPMVRDTGWQWRGNSFDPDMPLSIELHFCFWNKKATLFDVSAAGSFWQRRLTRAVDGLQFVSLNSADNLGYSSLHLLRNLLMGEWVLRQAYELATFLDMHASDPTLWQDWQDSHDPSLRKLEAIGFSIARRWFNCDLAPQVDAEITVLPPSIHRWIQDLSISAIEIMFHPSKERVLLHACLLDTFGAKLSLMQRTLLPVRIPAPGVAAVNVVNRRSKRHRSSLTFLNYLSYCCSRIAAHTRPLPELLWNGIRWWLSLKQLTSQFWMFLSASFFFDLGLSMYFFLFNIYLLGCGFTESRIGLLTSAMAVGSLAGALPAGMLARHIGLRRTLLACFVLAIGVFALRAIIIATPFDLILSFLAGITLSIWAVSISPSVAQLTTEQNRPFAFSLVFSIGIAVAALGGLAGGNIPGLLSQHLGVSATSASRSALLLACALVLLGILPISRLSFTTIIETVRPTMRLPSFLIRYLPAIAIWSLVTGSFSPFANLYFVRHLQLSLPTTGLIFSISQLSQVAAILVSPIAFRRLGLTGGIAGMQIATAIMLAALGLIHGALPASVVYICFTAAQWMSEPGMYSVLMAGVPPEGRSTASAWNVFVMSSCQAVAAAVAGSALTRFGYQVVLIATAAVATLAAYSFWSLPGTAASSAQLPQYLPASEQR